LTILTKQADEAMYDSKKNGRNKATLYEDVIAKKIKELQITSDNKKNEIRI
jgi:predicted signal transduction protein with EAL and GGDEF domain